MQHRLTGERRYLDNDLVVVILVLCYAAVFVTPPARRHSGCRPAYPTRVDHCDITLVRGLKQTLDRYDRVPRGFAARIAPPADRIQHRLRPVTAERISDVDDEKRHTLAEPPTRSIACCGHHRPIAFGKVACPVHESSQQVGVGRRHPYATVRRCIHRLKSTAFQLATFSSGVVLAADPAVSVA